MIFTNFTTNYQYFGPVLLGIINNLILIQTYSINSIILRDALEQSGTLDSILPWARSGFTGAQQYHSIVWAGDQNVDWTESDGLPSSIVGGINFILKTNEILLNLINMNQLFRWDYLVSD